MMAKLTKPEFMIRLILGIVLGALCLSAVFFGSGCQTTSRGVVARFNCEDYARAWIRAAQDQGLEVGRVRFMCDDGGAHCANFIENPDGSRSYYEPQTKEYFAPSLEELKNSFHSFGTEKHSVPTSRGPLNWRE